MRLGDLELHLLMASHWKAGVGLVARINGRVLVCETGIGTKLSEKRAQQVALREPEGLLHSLHRLGIRPEEVDAVVTTHLHWDHAGGLTRRGEGGTVDVT